MPQPDDLVEQQALSDQGKPPQQAVEAARIPMPPGGLFTRSLDGWGVDPNWLSQIALNDDRMLALEGYAPDLQVFDALLDDDVAMSTFQQRRLDVISRDWEVEPGADDARSKAAADHLRDTLKRLPWDDICDKMLHARWYGYGVAEAIWEIGPDGLLRPQQIYVPNRAWFAFNNAGELRMRANDQPEGEAVPDRKFWTIRCGGSHDAQHYGVGLAHWCYWPIYFKKNAIRFWALFLEKFGMPTMVGKFPPGWESDTTKLNDLLASLAAVGTDSAVVVPADAEVAPMEGTRSGSGASSYKEFLDLMNQAITRVVLTQTMTSTAEAAGLGSQQAQVHEDKGLAVAQSDSDLLAESFNTSIATWMTEWNFPGAIPPRVYRKLQDDDDLDTLADRDAKLDALGWERTEASFVDAYGEGYQRKAIPETLPQIPGRPRQAQLPPPGNDNRDGAQRAEAMAFAAQFAAHDPQPLYVSRKVVSGGQALLDWAAGQGFSDLVAVGDLHATVIYSRTPVDWFKLASESGWASEKVTVPAGGPRAVEALGDGDAIVLHVASWELQYRHDDLVRAGASHDYPDYWPHVTFANSAEGVDLDAIRPFQGKLEFGTEIWEPLDDPANPLPLKVPAVQFAAEQLDAIDRLVLAMSADGGKAVRGFVAPIREALKGLGPDADPEQLRVACLTALEQLDTSEFAAVLADPLVGVRAEQEAGLGQD